MRVRSLAKGMLTFIPGMQWLGTQGQALGGHTDSALYCYSVWLKHLTFLGQHGLKRVPSTVAELGPGGSIGVGAAAMLCGADHYVSLDVVRHTNTERNLAIFDELVKLFERRASRPDRGWPDFDPYLDKNLFPSDLLTPELLVQTLAPDRVASIRNAIANSDRASSGSQTVRYVAPWFDANVISEGTIDLIISHSVLEHVTDVDGTYRALHRWLRPGGWMSHQIDFKSHGLSKEWNGYRAYSELTWKLMLGKRPFMINREPCSVHLEQLQKNGFQILCAMKHMRQDGVPRSRVSPRWTQLSDEDLNCSGLFVQARKSGLN